MQWIFAGLGNPGSEYENTRHNVGRDVVLALAKKEAFTEWKDDKKTRSRVLKGELYGAKVTFLLPDTFMNRSGAALAPFGTSKKQIAQIVVVHDDLDLPLGTVKMSFGSGAGGHKGVESIQKALKTKDFVRVRIGISPSTPKGKTKKPDAEKVPDFVLGVFRAPEKEKVKAVQKKIFEGLELLLTSSLGAAMTKTNAQ